MRRVQAEGGFATVLRKGDPDRGMLMLLLQQRGQYRGILERVMGPDFEYCWSLTKAEPMSSDAIARFIAGRARLDADFWLIELDIADAERFVAETTASA